MYAENVNSIVYKFLQDLKRILGEKLAKVIVYGSYARGDYYEIEAVDISDMAEDDVIYLTNGAEVDMEEIIETLKANRNTWIDLIWIEILDDFFVSLEDSYLFD